MIFHQMMSDSIRRGIRKAQKEGLRVEFGITDKMVDEFYKLHLKTRQKQGVPIQPKRFFDLLKNNILDKGLGFISTAYKDKTPILIKEER